MILGEKRSHARAYSKRFLMFAFRTVIIVGICFIIFYPIFLKISVSLRSRQELIDNSVIFIPKMPTLEPFKMAYEFMDYSKAFINSFLVCAAVSVLHVISCTLTGYSFGRFKYPFKNFFFVFAILILMVPPQVLSLPTYISFRNFLGFIDLVNKPASLFVLYATANGLKSGLYIYLLMQFFKNMPAEIEEAALVDGAGFLKTMWSVMLPNSKTMLATVFLFTFIWQWTDVYYSTMFFKDYSVLSVNLGLLATNTNMYITEVLKLPSHPIMQSQMNDAGSILIIMPLILLYIFTNRFFVEGIERSGIVG